MKKRIVCIALLLSMLVLCLASCFRMPEPLPSDFVEGDEIVVQGQHRLTDGASIKRVND